MHNEDSNVVVEQEMKEVVDEPAGEYVEEHREVSDIEEEFFNR